MTIGRNALHSLILSLKKITKISVFFTPMNYPIPVSHQEIAQLQEQRVDEELIVAAIAGVINIARSEGQSLADLKSQVLAEDSMLDKPTRRWLSDLVGQAWDCLP